jgi:hypothetical protein
MNGDTDESRARHRGRRSYPAAVSPTARSLIERTAKVLIEPLKPGIVDDSVTTTYPSSESRELSV